MDYIDNTFFYLISIGILSLLALIGYGIAKFIQSRGWTNKVTNFIDQLYN